MIKLRVEGNLLEIEQVIKRMYEDDCFDILTESRPYANRNNKQYRVYLDLNCNIQENPKK